MTIILVADGAGPDPAARDGRLLHAQARDGPGLPPDPRRGVGPASGSRRDRRSPGAGSGWTTAGTRPGPAVWGLVLLGLVRLLRARARSRRSTTRSAAIARPADLRRDVRARGQGGRRHGLVALLRPATGLYVRQPDRGAGRPEQCAGSSPATPTSRGPGSIASSSATWSATGSRSPPSPSTRPASRRSSSTTGRTGQRGPRRFPADRAALMSGRRRCRTRSCPNVGRRYNPRGGIRSGAGRTRVARATARRSDRCERLARDEAAVGGRVLACVAVATFPGRGALDRLPAPAGETCHLATRWSISGLSDGRKPACSRAIPVLRPGVQFPSVCRWATSRRCICRPRSTSPGLVTSNDVAASRSSGPSVRLDGRLELPDGLVGDPEGRAILGGRPRGDARGPMMMHAHGHLETMQMGSVPLFLMGGFDSSTGRGSGDWGPRRALPAHGRRAPYFAVLAVFPAVFVPGPMMVGSRGGRWAWLKDRAVWLVGFSILVLPGFCSSLFSVPGLGGSPGLRDGPASIAVQFPRGTDLEQLRPVASPRPRTTGRARPVRGDGLCVEDE